MHKHLIALDFDKTLVPFDSFREYLKLLMRNISIPVWRNVFLRRCRIISSAKLKMDVCCEVSRSLYFQNISLGFAKEICRQIKWPNFFLEKYLYDSEYTVVILTASPSCYMKHIEMLLQKSYKNKIIVICSDFYNGQFIEMQGENKLKYLTHSFPQSRYFYTYSASDHISDMCWMKLFDKYDFIKQ